MVSNQATSIPEQDCRRAELAPTCLYILIACLTWVPFAILIAGLNPVNLFNSVEAILVVLMFFLGAVLASATAVGGGSVFNRLLQLT